MGILDDAIRQHLDLKRRLGAAEEELARLEDEAFGLPTRPGDPDFPETGSEPVQPLEGSAAGSQAEAPVEEPHASEPATEEEPAAEAPATAAEPVVQAPTPRAEEPPAPASEPIAEAGEPTPPPVAGVDTVEHDISAEPDGDDLELDLELDLDDGEAPEAEPEPSASEPGDAVTEKGTEQAGLEDTGERPTEPPIESLDTVEHQFEGVVEETGEAEVVEGELEEPAAEPGEDKGNGGEDEDVLEETPEFLRDQPEDDELWFEQGEPKDFDF